MRNRIFKRDKLILTAGIGTFIAFLGIGVCTLISLREKEASAQQNVSEKMETNDSQQSVPEKTEINDLQHNVSVIQSGLVGEKTFMEETSSHAWIKDFGTEFSENEYYVNALKDLVEYRILPDNTEAYVGDGKSWGNRAAFQDIDLDGQKELLLDIGGTCTADMGIYVYQLEENHEEGFKFRSEFSWYPSVSFYTNGFVRADYSHNHGYSDVEDFWPYQIFRYDTEADAYTSIWNVDAWERLRMEKDRDGIPFPEDIDKDKDGLIYRITNIETEELIMMDQEEYLEWSTEILNSAEELYISWIHIPQ